MTKLTSHEVAALQLQIAQLTQVHLFLLAVHDYLFISNCSMQLFNDCKQSINNIEIHLETLQNLLNEQ
jgi:hypothetical protein